MKVEQIELFHIRMPYVLPFETSFGVSTMRETWIVRMIADGVIGWGESVVEQLPGYSTETVQTAFSVAKDCLIPELFATSVDSPLDVPDHFAQVRGHNMAKAMFESAVWDIAAQQNKLSLQQYIGKLSGHGNLKDRVSVGVSVGIQESPAKLVERVLAYRADGYSRIKMKIKPGRDVADARAVRAALPNIMLMVDANSAYSIEEIDVIKQMDDLNFLMIEQPFAYDDIFQHSKLQKQIKTPVCLDESIHSVRDAQAMIELDAGRIINIKQGRLGGLNAAIATHDLCMKHNIPVWCGGMLETGIGRALNVALASLPNFKLPSDLSASNRYYNPDIIDPEFTLNNDSTLSVPTGIGLGVHVDMERLTRATIVHHVFRGDRSFASADTLTGVKLTGRRKG